MRHLITFNEKLGISKDLEDQVKSYSSEIKNNPSVSEFNFFYKNEKGNFLFTLNIKKINNEAYGNFYRNSNGDLHITLFNRNDYATLLHEVKHLDYYLRNPKRKNIYRDTHVNLTNSDNKDIKNISRLFYVMDENEFQSKYHSYYTEFETYLKDKLSDNKSNWSKEIKLLWDKFLESTYDKSWTYYKPGEFKFDDFIDNKKCNDILLNYIGNTNVILNNNIISDMIKILKSHIKKSIVRNPLTKDQRRKVFYLKRKFEKEITLLREKYFKKMSRIPVLMIDKFSNN